MKKRNPSRIFGAYEVSAVGMFIFLSAGYFGLLPF
jgi:hypothetical protein